MNSLNIGSKPDTDVRVESFSENSIYHLLALPNINSVVADQVSETSAMLTGHVENFRNESFLECGFVYGIKPNPTWEDSIVTSTNVNRFGQFKETISDLKVCTEYFFRAYATTSSWVVYSDERCFHTTYINDHTR